MPELTAVLREEDLTRRGAGGALDLTPYVAMIDVVRSQEGVGATVSLADGESQRTEKRRLSVAAKEQGYMLVWRKAPEGQLRFVLAKPGEPAPGGRKRREAPPAKPVPARGGRRKGG